MNRAWLRPVLVGVVESIVIAAVLQGLHLLVGTPLYAPPANSSFLVIVVALGLYSQSVRWVSRRVLKLDLRPLVIRSLTVIVLLALWYLAAHVYFWFPLLFALPAISQSFWTWRATDRRTTM